MSIVVSGFIELEKGNDDLSISPYKKKQILWKVADYARQKVVAVTPEGKVVAVTPKRKRKLKSSWSLQYQKLDGNQAIRLYSRARHDIYNEFGSSRNKSHVGFFSREIDANTDAVVDMMIKGVSNK